MTGHRETNRRIARRGAATLTAAAIAWSALGASAVQAQGFMRSPSINVSSRVPTINPNVARINPNIAGARNVGAANIAGRGAANIAGRGATNIAGRGAVNVAGRDGNLRLTPALTPRVAVVRPVLPYVRYQPNLYPACGHAYRNSGGECGDQPMSSADLGGNGNGSSPRGRNANGGPRRTAAQAAVTQRYLSDQVIAEVDGAQADELARRHRLTRVGLQELPLLGSAIGLFRITDRRSVETVRTELAADASVRSVQPNFRYVLQDQKQAATEGDPAQYALGKLRLPQAHALSQGSGVTVAVIDSGIDAGHPELANTIADSFDALGAREGPHVHGTGIAGAIVSHARLMGSAPAARILAIRAFGTAPNGAESTSFVILKSLDFAASHGAQIVNMSFAGPRDPLVERAIAGSAAKGIVLVAASGNAGPKSPPLYPAANPNVIAVSATDAGDRLFPASNSGSHIAVAAPGVDIFLPAPDGKYQVTSGTSFSAAYISGLAALMMERNPRLRPDDVRAILVQTARDLGLPGRDDLFGAGEADAFSAVTAVVSAAAPVAAAPDQPAEIKAAEPQPVPSIRDLSPATAAMASERPGMDDAARSAAR